jgi:hypothetical protein
MPYCSRRPSSDIVDQTDDLSPPTKTPCWSDVMMNLLPHRSEARRDGKTRRIAHKDPQQLQESLDLKIPDGLSKHLEEVDLPASFRTGQDGRSVGRVDMGDDGRAGMTECECGYDEGGARVALAEERSAPYAD